MRIEYIIQQQKEQLDLEVPAPDAWDKIRNKWKEDKKRNSFSWWKVAALVFISTSLGLLVYILSLPNQVNELASLGDLSEEYLDIENNYKSEIATLEASLNLDEIGQEEDFSWVVEEMKTLEEVNEIYRKDIGQIADQAQLVGALVDYYEKKIRLLKKLELEINRTRKNKNDEKDTTDTSRI